MAVHCAGNILVLQVDPQAGATVIQTIATEKCKYDVFHKYNLLAMSVNYNHYGKNSIFTCVLNIFLEINCHHYDSTISILYKKFLVCIINIISNILTDLKVTSLLHLHISGKTPSGTTYLVAADTEGAIAVWTRGIKKYEHYATLPKYKCVPSALAIDSARENLVVIYVDQNVSIFTFFLGKILIRRSL